MKVFDSSYDTATIFAQLCIDGRVLVRTGLEDEQALADYLVDFARSHGVPSEHNHGKQNYLWEITPKQAARKLYTYSDHNGSAFLHTDSQYWNQPEEFVGQAMVRSANCGGGKTLMLDSIRLLEQLSKTHWKRNLLDRLKLTDVPFATPDVFQAENIPTVIHARILDAQGIRYRRSTIDRGFQITGGDDNSAARQLVDWFTGELQSSGLVERRNLESGDIVFLDNHRILHGRTAFSDLSRKVLRVRFSRSNTQRARQFA